MKQKGIILAGGNGTRLYPLTHVISKQLLPVYDKPMVYYPLCTLMLAGIREILIITKPEDLEQFKSLLGSGEQWGVDLHYVAQAAPDGIAQSLIIGEEFLGDSHCALILGDNIFYGHALPDLLKSSFDNATGACVFAHYINNPERYGVVEFDSNNKVVSVEEKPAKPKSNYAITGLYFYDQQAVELAKSLRFSARRELEITDLNRLYLEKDQLRVELLGRGFAWFDTGTHQSLLEAGNFVATLENRQGLKIACPEEIAFRNGWIDGATIAATADKLQKNSYGEYLLRIINEVY